MPMTRTWEGLDLQARVHRAAGRAIIGIGTAVAVEAKKVTHVQFGTLRRSIHVAPPRYEGSDDERQAEKKDLQQAMMLSNVAEHTPEGPAIEVGSWLPYACAEWIGRGHPGITEGLEVVRGFRADSIVRQAFKEEGL